MQEFVDAVTAEIPFIDIKNITDTDDILLALQIAADNVGSGATVTWETEPETTHGFVIVSYNGEDSEPIRVNFS